MWVGVVKFQDYEVEIAQPVVVASPLTSWPQRKWAPAPSAASPGPCRSCRAP
ncbi:DUF417 family protein [Amycolatopsis sp. NPDC023774]|uniref:DUF417 family protein n=1 Tax=Amycolatopsis sp. NPDC023774 TaxID=3155015 RepID=UPI0033F0E58E